METVIRFENVSKRYRLGHRGNLREAIADLPRQFAASFGTPKRDLSLDPIHNDKYLWALRDTSFEINQGEVLGIIGPNGAGKSTILKLIAGITRPTHGLIEVRGRVGSLIELGAGFHPDLTGRENVFLNCQLMGMSRKEIAESYESIVEFAELREFMDVPVKRYSTGMYARLGFAVASHADMDILLVDEVLSVGDASFQRKSLERMLALVKSGKTVVFVSHNLYAVEHLCSRLLWIDRGVIKLQGTTREIVQAYLLSQEETFVRQDIRLPTSPRGLQIKSVNVLNDSLKPTSGVPSGCDVQIAVRYQSTHELTNARFTLGVTGPHGLLFSASMLVDGASVSQPAGHGAVSCRFKQIPLKPGVYQVFGAVWGAQGYDVLLDWSEWARFSVVQPEKALMPLSENYSVTHVQAEAPIWVPYEWEL